MVNTHALITSFLQSGALMSISPEKVLIGYGKRRWMAAPTSAAFYFPSFFLQEEKPWFEHEHMAEVPIEKLLGDIESYTLVGRSAPRQWKTTSEESYQKVVDELKLLFLSGTLIKAVPYICSQSEKSLTQLELLSSLRQLLINSQKYPVHIYGFWDSSMGILGATPEILFQVQNEHILETVACAGTCRRGTDETGFSNDPKEQYEHQLVVGNICEALSSYGKVSLQAQNIRQFNQLVHLVTPISVAMDTAPSFEDVVRAMHPTGALGALPFKAGMEWLQDFDQHRQKRERYGAPAGCVINGKKICLVAIRNIQWSPEGVNICVGSGVVPQSTGKGEWAELLLKLKSVKELLGLHEESAFPNKTLAVEVVQAFVNAGGYALCICPGSRNSPLVSLAAANPSLAAYYFYEERSAAFFAMGLSQRVGRPVAVVTTSGTAATELLPAITEAYYSQIPLMAITADRPRSYRGTNAPQSCEQVGLYGKYAPWSIDLEAGEPFDLSCWDQCTPAHVNVCFDEPLNSVFCGNELNVSRRKNVPRRQGQNHKDVADFLGRVKTPLVVLGGIKEGARESVRRFLLQLNVPIYAEAISGLRNDPALAHLRIHCSTNLWKRAEQSGYPIDGVLRVGCIPTVRIWRDLEDLEGIVDVCSVSEAPFSGLSWGGVVCAPLESVFEEMQAMTPPRTRSFTAWKSEDEAFQRSVERIIAEEPCAEASLVSSLAKRIPKNACVYLGNSQPIRYWDLAAPYVNRGHDVWATRGLNGIDGQVSTFLGLCLPDQSNWALLGDLTTLYDMPGFWAGKQLKGVSFNVVVINNSGGRIFSRMYKEVEFVNAHDVQFKALADLWGLQYEKWVTVPEEMPDEGCRIIEIVPDNAASQRFWNKLEAQGARENSRC